MFRTTGFSLLVWMILACSVRSQDTRKIPVSFLPPPLETATFSLGIYDAKSGRLVRRLKEAVTQSAFTAGLNGLIASWDGNDDAGKPVPPGKYAARGYAVGALKVEGDEIVGNDWAEDDEALRMERIEAIALVPDDNGLAILGTTPLLRQEVARYGGEKDELLWLKADKEPLAKVGSPRQKFALSVQADTLLAAAGPLRRAYQLSEGNEISPAPHVEPTDDAATNSAGKDGTVWKIEEGVLSQYSSQGERLRKLTPKEGEPQPVAVSASKDTDQLYLLEGTKNWQRVRGLSWKETKEEDGKPVSTWQTFFERNIRMPHPTLGLSPAVPVEINLAENPLDPGKPQKVSLAASYDDRGSYLATTDGLRLRRISERANLTAASLSKGKTANSLSLHQSDGAAWDEFSVEGARNMMAFDAGEIDMTADGEKAHTEKAAEPPDEP